MASRKSLSGTGEMTPMDPILIIEAPVTSNTNSYATSEHMGKS